VSISWALEYDENPTTNKNTKKKEPKTKKENKNQEKQQHLWIHCTETFTLLLHTQPYMVYLNKTQKTKRNKKKDGLV